MRRVLLPLSLLLPVILIYTAVRTWRQLERQKDVYLRNRVAAIAARLETLPSGADPADLLADEPGVVDVAVIRPESAEARDLAGLWAGRELFRTENAVVGAGRVFRAWIPFHAEGRLNVARIDVARSAADFLVVDARRNVLAAVLSAFAVAALALAAAWSERRAAKAETRQREIEHLASIGAMSAALAHEIRNPLGTIKGFAQLLQERTGGTEGSLIEPILSETSRLEALVGELLLYGRPPKPEVREIRWIDVARKLKHHAAAMRRTIGFTVETPDVTLRSDPNLLEQALLNLVRNAVEAAESEVSVRVEHDGRFRICVEDDGPGLTEDARKRLFEPFFTTKASGTGLGLAITRKLAEALGGRLSVGPRPGKGTAARIELPWNGSSS